jgi:hypothetical protein
MLLTIRIPAFQQSRAEVTSALARNLPACLEKAVKQAKPWTVMHIIR